MNSPFARHFHDYNNDIKDLIYTAIKKVLISRRGGKVTEEKTFTMINLSGVSIKSMSPLCLNEDFDLSRFL